MVCLIVLLIETYVCVDFVSGTGLLVCYCNNINREHLMCCPFPIVLLLKFLVDLWTWPDFEQKHICEPMTSRYRTCRAQIQGDLVESYVFLTNQVIMSKLSTNVHYGKKEVWLSDILTYTYQFSKQYLENK